MSADTPGNCTYEQIKGTWTFSIGQTYTSYKDFQASGAGKCDSFAVKKKLKIKLQNPDLAYDEFGHMGFWTMIYNQGFEIVIANRKYFAFSRYAGTMDDPISICNETMPGMTHDVLQRQWACYYGVKDTDANQPESPRPVKSVGNADVYWDRPFITNHDFISKINSVQNLWTAEAYPEYDEMSLRDLHRRSGGPASQVSLPKAAPVTSQQRLLTSGLPDSFDWRNINGQDFVGDVRNQGNCGSCYSFASAGLLESRIRIATNNSVQVVLSEQDVVECSPYSQGCDGGFPYLIGGKYAEDFGLALESCNPYQAQDGTCKTQSDCTRYYATNYHYVGGYYGACNEEVMKLALIHDGPLAVGFEVYPDFKFYKGGVYVHTGLQDHFNPFELTNHAVLLVGYGVDAATGTKYWIVKNSWGNSWGESGYFRIRRGTDECAFESLAVNTQAVL